MKKGACDAPFSDGVGELTASSPPSSPSSSSRSSWPFSSPLSSGFLEHREFTPCLPGAAAAWHDRPRGRRSRSFWSTPARAGESHQKLGGGTCGSHPRNRHRLALLRRLLGGLLLRAGLRSLLRHSSSWESWLPSCHRLPRGHNRWAERSTCIRDVDYGRENHPVKHNLPQKSKKLMPRARVMRQAVSTIGSRLSTARARIALTIAFRSNARRSAGGPRTACARTAARTAHR